MDAVAQINDPQCELWLLCACTGISKLYFAMRTCPPCVFESAQRSFDMALYSTLERIVTASGPVFNTSMEIDLLSNPSEIVAPKLIKTMTDIYFTMVAKDAEFTFSLSPRQMALWKSQREDHTSDWLRAVHISGLGQTMNACSRVFAGDIYGDRVVSCVGIIGLDVCVDLTGSSPLTQIEMADFVPSRAVIDVAQRKRVKYMAKCAAIGYEFLPFSFSSLGELEDDAVTLLKRIQKFSMAQELGHWGACCCSYF
ncbi:hypothetical protein Tco_0133590 [Tanacetum coccineum]